MFSQFSIFNSQFNKHERKHIYQTAGDGDVYLHLDSHCRCHFVIDIAGRTISGHCTSYHYGACQLYRCRCRCGDELCYHAVGRKHQRGRKHDLYYLNRHQFRFGYHYGVLQTRNRSGHGTGKRTESCGSGTRFVACRSYQDWCNHYEASDLFPSDGGLDQYRRYV